ncbi:MAG: hypothetical protein HRT64_14210, partial [Erythrobacter sp.]|nr:hypothetical protein [Erythrobacter sp.]
MSFIRQAPSITLTMPGHLNKDKRFMGFVGKFWRFLVGIKDALVLIFMLLFFATL